MVPLVEEFKRRLNIGGIGSDYDSDTNRANASPPQAGPGHERAPVDDAECECTQLFPAEMSIFAEVDDYGCAVFHH